MSPPRPLLRLDEKVAAETRRLAALGGPPRPLAAGAAVAGALVLLGVLAGLPLPAPPPAPQGSTFGPDLPIVWRWGPPITPVARAPVPPVSKPTPPPSSDNYEPVPEPPPEMPAGAIPIDVEALIPAPGPLPAPSGALERPVGESPQADVAPVVRVRPVYPMAARSLGAEGSVALELTVRPDGSVEDAAVTGCTRPGVGFEDAALAAVRRWQFAAAPGGAPRSITVQVDFKGRRRRP